MASNEEPGEEFWLFGYGYEKKYNPSPNNDAHAGFATKKGGVVLNRSLIWKPPPHYGQTQDGRAKVDDVCATQIDGYRAGSRVMSGDSGSQDHRGTPEAPGRVVTLIDRAHWASLSDAHADAPERVWGVAYRIRAEKVAEVKEYLDIREINGYTIHYAPFHPAAGGPSIRTLVYIGTPDNPQFTGPQDPARLAEHIHRSAGPSGANRDYLFGLERALDELSPESGDAHVTDLAVRVRAIEARRGEGVVGGDEAASHEFKKVDSVDEQEETEKT
ncbi:hypothetical protein DL769_001846 [Monosporascus sp. CRB-8-3]|nr:hypothetical protein DL769_001846 [Monosporascus sp. CRB-8-3]